MRHTDAQAGRQLLGAFACVLLALLAGGRASAEDDDLGQRVNRALDRAAKHLVAKQAKDGSWQKEDKVHPLGRTALCTFALLHEGLGPDDEPIRKALAFLGISKGYASQVKARSTYEAGCLLLMLNALGPGYDSDMSRLCEWLCKRFDMGPGLWGYPDGVRDLSNTQYAAMGLKVGAQHGFRVPRSIWNKLMESMPALQSETGGVRYRPGDLYRASMTHAALLIMDYAREGLGLKRLPRDAEACRRKAIRWLEDHYDIKRHPFGDGWSKSHYFYYMYGLERFAMHFGHERIAEHDWYREGAEELLSRQEKNGSWGNLEQTCFAILFLRRATLARPKVITGMKAPPGAKEKPAPEPKKVVKPRPQQGLASIRSWLFAGPYRDVPGEDLMLARKHFDVRRTPLREGGRAGDHRWWVHDASEDKVEFRIPGSGDQPPWCAWYAGVWLHAAEGVTAYLWFGSDDGFRCYLNGRQVFEGHHHGHCGDDHYRIPLVLKEGPNALVLKVENTTYYCHMRARLSDEKGGPLTAVRVSTSKRRRR